MHTKGGISEVIEREVALLLAERNGLEVQCTTLKQRLELEHQKNALLEHTIDFLTRFLSEDSSLTQALNSFHEFAKTQSVLLVNKNKTLISAGATKAQVTSAPKHPFTAELWTNPKIRSTHHMSQSSALVLRSAFHTDEAILIPIYQKKKLEAYLVLCFSSAARATQLFNKPDLLGLVAHRFAGLL